MKPRMKFQPGFTLIELLVAFGVVAVATVAILALLQSNIRLIHESQNVATAAQAAVAPNLGVRDLGVRAREIDTEEIDVGPIRLVCAILDMVPPDRSDGVRVRLYK